MALCTAIFLKDIFFAEHRAANAYVPLQARWVSKHEAVIGHTLGHHRAHSDGLAVQLAKAMAIGCIAADDLHDHSSDEGKQQR